MSNTGSSEPTIRALVKSVTEDTQRLIKAQTELLRTEVKDSQQEAGATAGMFIGAAVAGALGAVFLLVTIAYVLVALGLPVWAGFGIVTLVLLIVAAILAALGRKRAKSIEGIPLAKEEFEKTKLMLSGSGSNTTDIVPSQAATDAVARKARSAADTVK